MVTKYGLNTFLVCSTFAAILVLIGLYVNNGWIKYPLIVLGVGFFLFTLNFFRDPDRTPPSRDDVIVSPADGTVIIIKDIFEEEFVKDTTTQLSIFMSPLNVHVNRIPISGTIGMRKYIEGDYLVASYEKADKRNERTEIGIDCKHGKMMFTQVAGFVARRIVCPLKEGESVKMGNRFGMIKFGSRSDVFAPKKWKLKVKVGDQVTAGETILFELDK
ncbi:MAG: phosphatidylserine decarboxylase [Stygiobacter sp. RIFOXYC12_FULL_38_8]|nr:MAG: phosphatidylserine decarboxylase [Stygiobacter sp. GWC2_38_9]OGV08386.1 MAG: phosphatidylserine decarboxylase [Stygiobacter sp. RIFOXYB2_FULL_37_11]OGV14932.1 MAG: phosphatidylserine decarboxylase [Stygiobacter sp. RIFOXYC2_FULL_38_25]OGV23607.1 MAG: phosphatidylserine decarboxylase [Stygiobacter sp. RIFOXYC12_FULL_38_8]OGV79408.1 MAG: phosphatidylserine decarboxylase [Stygiobacter sp. GWF2_38_21]OGV99012.1 MAG: phosphatidylserine decarboxylase [Melioribacter sp. RIFOXYB12_FULL_38_5]